MAETGGAYRFAAIGAISSLGLGAGKIFGLRLGWIRVSSWGRFPGEIFRIRRRLTSRRRSA